MNQLPPAQPTHHVASFSITDALQILFKWKVFVISMITAGLVIGGVLWLVVKPLYLSTASILVLYVAQAKSAVAGISDDDKLLSPDARGANILGTELGILTSLDLCEEVVNLVGGEKLVGSKAATYGSRGVAMVVQSQLSADSPRKSNLINVSFTHDDPEIARTTLGYVLERYKEKHLQVHRNTGSGSEFVRKQAEQWKARLLLTESEIRKKLESVGVNSIEDAKKAATQQLGALRTAQFTAEADVAELKGRLRAFEGTSDAKGTNGMTNAVYAGPIPQEHIAEYKSLVLRHQTLLNQKMELETRLTDAHPTMSRVTNLIHSVEIARRELEQKYPRIESTLNLSREIGGQQPVAGAAAASALHHQLPVSIEEDKSRIVALNGKIEMLKEQAKRIRDESAQISAIELDVSMLQRRKILEEENYKNYSAALERAELDNRAGAERSSNINVVQTPSAPAPDAKAKIKKIGAPVAFCFVVAFGIPFLVELILRPTVNSPRHLELALKRPAFFSIPYSPRAEPPGAGRSWRRLWRKSKTAQADVPMEPAVAPWDESHALRPHFQALRDRTVVALEELRHKPKLIAVTGCGQGVGTTSIASGLASTLSETGDGRVLLVDLNWTQGAAHPFFHGSPASLGEIIEDQGKEGAPIHNNLFIASGTDQNSKLSRVVPSRFMAMLPKLKSSTYDYIIFDLPAVGPTSFTPLIVKMMDLVVLVVESSKTSQHLLMENERSLKNGNSQVVTVLNKKRDYLPSWLAGHG